MYIGFHEKISRKSAINTEILYMALDPANDKQGIIKFMMWLYHILLQLFT